MQREVPKGQLIPVKFDMTNKTVTAPGCEPLPVCVCNDGHVVSCWELSDDQIKEITETRRLWLGIRGGQPPVWLTVDYPFIESNEWSEIIEEKA